MQTKLVLIHNIKLAGYFQDLRDVKYCPVCYFQINRQPDPYSSHCVDSWENTGINVPEGMEYSLAVRTTSFRRSLMLVVSTLIREADKKENCFFKEYFLNKGGGVRYS